MKKVNWWKLVRTFKFELHKFLFSVFLLYGRSVQCRIQMWLPYQSFCLTSKYRVASLFDTPKTTVKRPLELVACGIINELDIMAELDTLLRFLTQNCQQLVSRWKHKQKKVRPNSILGNVGQISSCYVLCTAMKISSTHGQGFQECINGMLVQQHARERIYIEFKQYFS